MFTPATLLTYLCFRSEITEHFWRGILEVLRECILSDRSFRKVLGVLLVTVKAFLICFYALWVPNVGWARGGARGSSAPASDQIRVASAAMGFCKMIYVLPGARLASPTCRYVLW